MELFTFPVSFEIWNIYLSKFVKRYVSYFFFRKGFLYLTFLRAERNSNAPETFLNKHLKNARPSRVNLSSLCMRNWKRTTGLLNVLWQSTIVLLRQWLMRTNLRFVHKGCFFYYCSNSTLPHRCSQSTSPRQPPILVCPLLDQSTNELWRVRLFKNP